MIVKYTRVDDVRRLTLHGTIDVVAFVECNFAFNQCAVERNAEIVKAYEAEVLADVEFYAVIVGSFGVDIGVYEVGAAGYGVSPFYRVGEFL